MLTIHKDVPSKQKSTRRTTIKEKWALELQILCPSKKAFFLGKKCEIKTQINTLYPQYSQQQTKNLEKHKRWTKKYWK